MCSSRREAAHARVHALPAQQGGAVHALPLPALNPGDVRAQEMADSIRHRTRISPIDDDGCAASMRFLARASSHGMRPTSGLEAARAANARASW